jgi:hypothetical protein
MGTQQIETLKMILDAGFEIESELDLPEDLQESYNDVTMKGREDLKPACS